MTTRFSTYLFGALKNAKQLALQAAIGIALLSAGVLCALAQDGHSHPTAQHQQPTTEQKGQADALLEVVRDSTERLKMCPLPRRRAMPFNSVA